MTSAEKNKNTKSVTNPPSTARELRGAMTALVTPFRAGQVDWPRFEILLSRQIEAKIDWLVPLGTTGESPTLSDSERGRIIETSVARAREISGVMIGTGTNCTAKTIEYSREAARLGASAILVVTPYYNRPTQEGLYRHFASIADAVEIPIVLYNVPARTAVTLTNDTIVHLREKHQNIAAVKDATGNVDALTDLLTRCDIAVLCGDDSLTWPMMALGAVGVISVLSNLLPELISALVDAAALKDAAAALRLHRRVYDLATGIGRFGPNPVPIKTAMALAGLVEEEFRLPLCPLTATDKENVAKVMRRHEISTIAG